MQVPAAGSFAVFVPPIPVYFILYAAASFPAFFCIPLPSLQPACNVFVRRAPPHTPPCHTSSFHYFVISIQRPPTHAINPTPSLRHFFWLLFFASAAFLSVHDIFTKIKSSTARSPIDFPSPLPPSCICLSTMQRVLFFFPSNRHGSVSYPRLLC